MPAHGEAASPELPIAALLEALRIAPGPVILVSNEIGMGVIPMGQQVRSFVDALGNLHQQVAAQCQRVTLMVAGFPVFVRDVA
jgi:adenosylcobinamide kinase/adenosylcobinamide-phosphate guanylyltransferase